MPSSLRTARTHTAPTTRRKGTGSFPGLHAADDTCPSILAGVCIRYMRGMMSVAHKGEWRPNGRASKTTNRKPFLRCCTAHTATSAQLAVNGSARGLLPLLASTSCWELCTPHHDHATAASLHCTSAPRPHPNTGRPPGRPIAAVGLPQAS